MQSDLELPVALVVGNEKAGIDPVLRAECHRVVAVPMLGQKGSLNVVVAFGIAAYYVRFGLISIDERASP